MEQWFKKLDGFLEDLFLKKLPPLPKNARELITKALPWLVLILVLTAIPGTLAALGLGAIATPFWILGGGRNFIWMIAFLLSLAQIVLMAMALPALFSNGKKGWQFLFYSSLLSLLSSLLFVSLGNLVIVGISFYLLYQVKSSYK